MYAEQRYVPRTPRTVSLGAAVAINGLLIAGLISMIPNFMPKPKPTVLIGENIPLDTPPPPEPLDKPIVEKPIQAPDPYIPPTANPLPDQPTIESTPILPTVQPPIVPTLPTGPATVTEVPKPLPLVGAQQDPRFARDYQPEYPAQELRAERDGSVSVRVLIGADGRVKAVEQVSATSNAFFEATRRQALAKWRFKPATRGGIPQESWKTMSVRFELKNL